MWQKDYLFSIVVLITVVLGIWLPIGVAWEPFFIPLLGTLMFLTCLKITSSDLKASLIDFKSVIIICLLVFGLMPLLSSLTSFLPPMFFVGTVLIFSSPSAVLIPFFAKILGGKPSFSLVIISLTSLLSIVLLPLILSSVVGYIVEVDAFSIIKNLIKLILIPLIAASLCRRFFSERIKTLNTTNFSLFLMFFLVWGLISLGVKDMAPFQFIEVGCVVLILLLIGYLAGWLIGKKINREYGITMALLTGSRNYTLAMVIGLTAFGVQVLPPIIAYIVVQNLSLIPLQILLKSKRNS